MVPKPGEEGVHRGLPTVCCESLTRCREISSATEIQAQREQLGLYGPWRDGQLVEPRIFSTSVIRVSKSGQKSRRCVVDPGIVLATRPSRLVQATEPMCCGAEVSRRPKARR